MPDLLVRSFTPFLLAFQPCFTQPSFSSFSALACAWILCSGRRSLTRVIQSAQLGRFKHFCAFHRFFSQARWNLDDLGYCVFQLLLPFCPGVLTGAVDDTLARKSGRHIWGAGMHHDPLRSAQKRPAFSFGHSWVVLSLHVSFPFAPQKTWAIPVLVRLYRKRKSSKLAPGRNGKPEKKQTGQATGKQYRTRPQLALEMIQIVARWLGPRKLRVLGDSEYAGGSISRHLPANAELISRMTMKAALFEPPPAPSVGRGRRRTKGQRLPSPGQMAQDPGRSWIKDDGADLWPQGQGLVPVHRRVVVFQRRAAASAYRGSPRSSRPPPRRLFLLHRPHAAAAANPRNLRSALAAGGVFPRRETVPRFRRPAKSRLQSHPANRSPRLLYL
jgi:hypothetical protein